MRFLGIGYINLTFILLTLNKIERIIKMITIELISDMLILLVVVYFVLFVFSIYRKDNKKKISAEVQKYTFEFCISQNLYVSKLLKKSIKHIHIRDEEEKENILLIFDKFEEFSIGICMSVLSEDVMMLYYGNDMMNFYIDNRYYLLEIREEEKNSDLYSNYERLMEQWEYSSGSNYIAIKHRRKG